MEIPATQMQGVFSDAAGNRLGDFSGMVCVHDPGLVEGHGEGGYEVKDGGVEVIFTAGEVTAVVERAFIRRGIIGFRAWLSEK